jgi:hypothetical protein
MWLEGEPEAQLEDLTDDLLRLILPQQAGASSTCHRYRAIILSRIQERTIEGDAKLAHMAAGLKFLAKLPSLSQLHIFYPNSHENQMPFNGFRPLSRIARLTQLQIIGGLQQEEDDLQRMRTFKFQDRNPKRPLPSFLAAPLADAAHSLVDLSLPAMTINWQA